MSSEGATDRASQGQRSKVRRRAESMVSLPAMEKKRRRRVLVVTIAPQTMRAVQRASDRTASQAPWRGSGPRGDGSTAVLEVSDGVLDLGVAPMVGLQAR